MAVLTTLSLALPPVSALATDRYVDDQGSGVSPCTNPMIPCPSILTAITVPAVSGDVIHVGGTATQYAGNLALPNGVSLIKDSFASGAGITTTGTATINTTGNASPALILTAGTAARLVSGFTLRGGATPGSGTLLANSADNITISGNTFDDHSTGVPVQLRISGGGSPHVTGNTFIGANDGVIRSAVTYSTSNGGSPEIDHNLIDSFFQGIQIAGTTSPPTIFDVHDNTITNLYDEPTNAIPIAITSIGASGTLTGNLATEIPGQDLGGGLFMTQAPNNGTGTPLVASHNQTYGFQGPAHFAMADPVVLTNDVFSGVFASLSLFNSPGATLRNVTAVSTGGGAVSDIALTDSPGVTIDSSFVGTNGITIGAGSTCTSSFSLTTHAPVCGMAQVADPMFANPAGNDFHLLAGSPLIDAGNPAPPPAAETDIDGNPRAVMAIPSCAPRRDIGADEFVPSPAVTPLDCSPIASDTAAPETFVSGKRKVKTRKKKVRVSWTFAASEPGTTFACSLDGRPFSPCISPFSAKLRRGSHTLSVRSTDATGNVDPTPASFTTKVKRKRLRR